MVARANGKATSRIAGFTIATLFATALAFGTAGTAYAELTTDAGLAAQSVAHFPDVTDEMVKPSYWSDKQKDPTAVLADRATIDRLNAAGVEADGTMLQPLKTAREYFYDADQQKTLKDAAAAELRDYFVGQCCDENGSFLTQEDADAIVANYPTDGAAPSIPSQYAIVTTHTTMRAYPTDKMLGYTYGDADDDNLYLSLLRVNEPLIVRAQSVDGRFFLCISSCLSASWVPAADIAICKDKAEWLAAWDIPQGQELVVTGYKVRTEQSRVTPNTANRMLYMGTVLERIDWEDASKLVGTRAVYNNHVCYLPVREADGTYSKAVALIAESAEVSEGYLPLTSENIADVAFNSLGQMYGWGGMLEANDCSGYVRDVYKCFGLELARNTTWQQNMLVRYYDLSGLDDEHKAAAIAQMPLGTVLFWGGHEMIYLGQENGKLYVISSLGSVGNLFGDSGTLQIKSVAINTLDMVRGNRNTWLHTLTAANIPYREAGKGPSELFDLSFYESAVSWPQKSTYAYTGKAIEPAVSIPGLVEDTDYTVKYTSNVKPGATATVTLTGIGAYTSSVSSTFKIGKASQTIAASKSVSKKLTASAKTKKLSKDKVFSLKTLAGVSAKTSVKYTKTNNAGGSKIVVDPKTGKVTAKKGLKANTYTVKVKLEAPASASYKAAKAKTITLKVLVKA